MPDQLPYLTTECAYTDRDYSLLKSYLETQIIFHPKDPIESYAQVAKYIVTIQVSKEPVWLNNGEKRFLERIHRFHVLTR